MPGQVTAAATCCRRSPWRCRCLPPGRFQVSGGKSRPGCRAAAGACVPTACWPVGTRTGSPATVWSPMEGSPKDNAVLAAAWRPRLSGPASAILAAAEPAGGRPALRRSVPVPVVAGVVVDVGRQPPRLPPEVRAAVPPAACPRPRADRLRRPAGRAAAEPAAPLDDAVRQPDQGRQSLRRRGPQPDPDPVPLGQPRDGEQAHVPGDGHVDRRRVVEPPVHFG